MKTPQLAITVTGLILALISGAAQAQTTFYFRATSNNLWNNGANWSTTSCSGSIANAIPTASDDVVICDAKTAVVTNTSTISSAYARTVTLDALTNARIEIQPDSSFDATLTLGSGSSPLTSTLGLGAGIRLLDAPGSSNKATLAFVSADHTLSGDVDNTSVQGFDDLAQITIADDKTLTCETMTVGGHLKILGDGKFVSRGSKIVAGIAAGTLVVAPYELDDLLGPDNEVPVWSVLGGETTLQFSSDISIVTGGSLVGDFVVGADPTDVMIVDEPLTTTGGLTISAGATLVVNQNLTMGSADHPCQIHDGSVDVVAGKSFTHH